GPSWINPAAAPAAGTVATLLGSSLGQALGSGNEFAQLAQGTAIRRVSTAVASQISSIGGIRTSGDQTSVEQAADNALTGISTDLAKAFFSAGGGNPSRFLTGELAPGGG